MATILRFEVRGDSQLGKGLRDIRKQFGLSLAQAASAADVSPATIENWERSGGSSISPEQLSERYAAYCARSSLSRGGNNLVFGCYPLRLARQLLEVDVEELAREFGYSSSSWLKLEANVRTLPSAKIAALEEKLRQKLAQVCC